MSGPETSGVLTRDWCQTLVCGPVMLQLDDRRVAFRLRAGRVLKAR